MKEINHLTVKYHGHPVGSLALYKKTLVGFEYDSDWLKDGFAISPLSLPLQAQVFLPRFEPFDGLFGVFSDSLPDGWGRLLVDRLLNKNHLNPLAVSHLTRLAIVGKAGMGALTYEPTLPLANAETTSDLDQLSLACANILQTKSTDELDELFTLGGSSGGARPKILTTVDGADWLIKFHSAIDAPNIGRQEYDYSLCAKACGLNMPETRLFPSNLCEGYFGVKRFDRISRDKNIVPMHMLSAGALLETSHRIPSLDYDILMKLTMLLTNDYQEIEQLYRLMCFNVFAHNRDDHAKNFSFLYNEDLQRWQLAPAYDLTYSFSLGGEHATSVHGNGVNPGTKDLLAVAKGIGMNMTSAKKIAADIQALVQEHLRAYLYKN